MFNTHHDQRPRRLPWLIAPLAALLAGHTAYASTELNAQYNARSVGMGGTGVAFIGDGSSLYLNPATLDMIQDLAITADFMAVPYRLGAPFIAGQQDESELAVAPYFLLGGGYRLNDRVVVGFAAFPTLGIGTTYKGVTALGGADAKVSVATIELAPGVSYKLHDRLSLGLTYRVTYTASETELAVPAGEGLAIVNQDTHGTSWLGVSAGLLYRPTDQISLGVNYRSKTSATLTGTQTIAAVAEQDIEQDFATPQEIRVGSAVRLLDNKLLVALDAKAVFYRATNKELVTRVTDAPPGTPDEATTSVVTQNWRNVVAGNLGAELALSEAVRVRAGYAITSSATPESHPSPFIAPPAMLSSYHVGAGLRLAQWDFDVAAFYSASSAEVENDQYPAMPSPTPGRYEFTILSAALSATYRR